MFEHNLNAVTLGAAGTTTDATRGRRIVALLVETLGGYAYGMVVGSLARAVATCFGAGYAARVRGAARATARVTPHATTAKVDDDLTRELAHAPLDLAAELIAALWIRCAVVGEQLRDVVRSLPADHRRHALIEQLRAELEHDDRFALEITTAWHYATAVIERRAVTPSGSPRARELWRTWSRLAGHGDVLAPAERSDDFITRIG